jgi:hypothetical protein
MQEREDIFDKCAGCWKYKKCWRWHPTDDPEKYLCQSCGGKRAAARKAAHLSQTSSANKPSRAQERTAGGIDNDYVEADSDDEDEFEYSEDELPAGSRNDPGDAENDNTSSPMTLTVS